MFGPGSRQRAATLVTFFSHGLLFASWTAHIPAVKGHLGLSDATLGAVLLCMPIGSVAAMTVVGRLLPFEGSSRMVRVSIAGYCAAGPFVGLAATRVELACALFVWGAFQGALDVSMNTQAVAVERVQARPLMPLFHGGWSVGALSGAGVGALAVGVGVGLSVQLLVLAVPVLVAAGLLSSSMVSDQPSEVRHGRPLWRNRTLLILGAIALASMLCEGAAADWSAVYLRGSGALSPGVAGLGYTTFALLMAGVRFAGTRLLVRFQRVLPALALLASFGMAVALLSGSGVLGLVGFACLGAGTALVVPTVFSAAGRLPGVPSGVGIATVSAIGWVGFVFGPPLIGQLAGVFGLRGALGVLPVLALFIGAGVGLSSFGRYSAH